MSLILHKRLVINIRMRRNDIYPKLINLRPHFRVHLDRGFWLELWKAILPKCELTTQNINFFNLKLLSRKSTDCKEYFSYIKRVYIFSRKNFRAIWNFSKNTFFFVFFCFLRVHKQFFNLLGFPIGFEKFHFRHDFFSKIFFST